MGTYLCLLYALCVFVASSSCPIHTGSDSGGSPADELQLTISMTTGEHSRDSNSTATDLAVSGNILTYQQAYHGAHSGRQAPVKKQYMLTDAERKKLIALLNKKNLWITKTISKPPQQKGTSFYFELTIKGELNGRKSSISIDGARNNADMGKDITYRNALSVVEELFQVIRRTDPDTQIPQLIEAQ